VTNTNDFRRYSYQNDPSYLISGFNVSRGSQAPKIRPQTQPQQDLKVRQNSNVKSNAQLKSEQKASFKKAVRIAILAVASLVMVALVLNSFAVKNELTKEISKQEVLISNAQSENISLQSQLDAMVSISMIDQYAVEKLGMTKVKSNQIQYIDVNEYKASLQTQDNEATQESVEQSSNN
jgi:cell division protein FtsL